MTRAAIRRGCDLGLVEMKSTGRYGLTKDGRNFLDLLDLLRELDDRPGGTQASSPLAAGSTRVTAPGGGAPPAKVGGMMGPGLPRNAGRE